MSNRAPLVVPHPRIAVVTTRMTPFKHLCRRGRAVDPKASPSAALTSATESLHGDSFSVFADISVAACRLDDSLQGIRVTDGDGFLDYRRTQASLSPYGLLRKTRHQASPP
jgi:hypothetical protein